MTVSSLSHAHQLDQQDPLAKYRTRFAFDGRGNDDLIYLDGNSLGRLPLTAVEQQSDLIQHQWGERLIRSWNEGWIDMPQRIGDKIAKLIGAEAGEVIVADSTSVNLFKLALAALRANPGRAKIVTDDLNFPSDVYILSGVAELLGNHVEVQIVKSPDEIHGPVEELEVAIDDQTALVALSHTCFKSAYTYDMTQITRMAHDAGALMLWDMSHSVGALPGHLSTANADLAVGCSYKYLNGGPGAPAWLYVRRNLHERLHNPITGWMGQKDMFDFALHYEAASGLQSFLTGTSPVLSLSAIEPGVDMLLEAGMDKVRAKSIEQSNYLIKLWADELKPLGFRLNTPRDVKIRGSHVSLGHDEGWGINRALIEEMNVLPDFRAPENIRFGITPLYTSFVDIFEAVQRTKQVVQGGLYQAYRGEKLTVT